MVWLVSTSNTLMHPERLSMFKWNLYLVSDVTLLNEVFFIKASRHAFLLYNDSHEEALAFSHSRALTDGQKD